MLENIYLYLESIYTFQSIQEIKNLISMLVGLQPKLLNPVEALMFLHETKELYSRWTVAPMEF